MTDHRLKPEQGADGRFKTGNIGGGRPVGARNKLSTAFLDALANDFEKHGGDVIQQVREAEPAAYLRVIASLMPRRLEMEPTDLASMSDAELEAIVRAGEGGDEGRRQGAVLKNNQAGKSNGAPSRQLENNQD